MSLIGHKTGLFGGGGGGGDGEGDVVDLNLTPLMDVMSNILFFLLAGFGAALLSYIAASVPVQAEADTDKGAEDPRTDKVVTNIQIKVDEYRISISQDKLAPEKIAKYSKVIPRKGKDYDTQALQDWVWRIKEDFPASDTAMIVPNSKSTYEEIIKTLEVVKDKKLEGLGEKVMKLLDKLVVADIVQADPVAAPPPAGGG